MMAPQRQTWFAAIRRGACALAVGLLLIAGGCKSKDGNGKVASNDPLINGPGRIPKQNIPVPDRGTAGGTKRTDPLLGSPTSGTRANAGTGYTDDPARFKGGPYVPGPSGSPAALAGRTKDDGEGLRIATPGGVPLTPAGGMLAAGPAPTGPSDVTLGELANFGVKRSDYRVIRDGNPYKVRVRVPIAESGPVRSFTGRGPNEAAAVQQVVEQIKAERK